MINIPKQHMGAKKKFPFCKKFAESLRLQVSDGFHSPRGANIRHTLAILTLWLIGKEMGLKLGILQILKRGKYIRAHRI